MSRSRYQSQSFDSEESPPAGNSPAADRPDVPAMPVPDAATVLPQRRSPKSKRTVSLQPSLRVLIGLTLLTALLLLPFAFSAHYLDWLRAESIDLHQLLRGEWYKQATGYTALVFVLLEGMLTVRKRSRSWIGSVKVPGSMQLWRSVHIFLGVGLVSLVLVHTVGSNGLNFNAIFLWVFFATTLTALVGVVAETGLLETPRTYFGQLPGGTVLTKGPLIRGLRSVWLVSHIFFVCVFALMLVFHIILAYYFQ